MPYTDPIGIQLMPLAERYIVACNKEDEKVKAFVTKQWVPVHVLELVYASLSGTGEFPRLEELTQDEKNRIWKTVCEWSPEKSKPEKISMSKALYLIEVLQQKKVG